MTAETPLSFDDAIEILGPAFPDDSLILVGGQAVNYWLAYYRDRGDPALARLAGVTSDDVDFVGAQTDARRFARVIGGRLYPAIGSRRGPLSAVVYFNDATGQERRIDFLWAVQGLSTERIRETAIEVEPVDETGAPRGFEIKVLHPVLCLTSRVHNTYSLDGYQTERALRQLDAAIGCARGFVVECCDRSDMKAARGAIQEIEALACERAGDEVFRLFQRDVLNAIPLDSRLGDTFFREHLPRIRRRAGRQE